MRNADAQVARERGEIMRQEGGRGALRIAALLAFLTAMVLGLQGDAALARIPPTHYAVVLATVDKHIVPHMAALRDAAQRLPGAVAQVCRAGDGASREALVAEFRSTVRAWAGVEFLRFGPMMEAVRRERMSFWPDPRGVMKRQLRTLIAAGDSAALDAPDAIIKQSAAVQGLPALEALIADTAAPLGPQEDARYRCKLAQAIANNVGGIARDLYDGWTQRGGWRERMLEPGSDNAVYKEPQEAANELVKAFLTGLALVGDGQVKPQLDPNSKFRPPYAATQSSSDYFAGGVQSLAALYRVMDLEAFLDDDKAWVKNWVGGAWPTLLASDGAGGRLPDAEKIEAPPLAKVQAMFSGLRKITITVLSPAAGLTVGFNELDGD